MKWSCKVHEGWTGQGSSDPNESALAAFLVRSIKSVIERTEDPEYKLFAKSEDDKRSTTTSSSEPEHEKKNKPRRSRIMKSVVEKMRILNTNSLPNPRMRRRASQGEREAGVSSPLLKKLAILNTNSLRSLTMTRSLHQQLLWTREEE